MFLSFTRGKRFSPLHSTILFSSARNMKAIVWNQYSQYLLVHRCNNNQTLKRNTRLNKTFKTHWFKNLTGIALEYWPSHPLQEGVSILLAASFDLIYFSKTKTKKLRNRDSNKDSIVPLMQAMSNTSRRKIK